MEIFMHLRIVVPEWAQGCGTWWLTRLSFKKVAAIAMALSPLGMAQPRAISSHIHRSQLSVEYRPLLSALGDRLEVSGKERLLLSSTLIQSSRAGGGPQSVALVIEIGSKLRMDGPGNSAVAFDGQQLNGSAAAAKQDQDLIDSLVYDSTERFLTSRVQALGIRRIALRARMSAPQNVTAATPFCDVYQVFESNQAPWKASSQSKMYCFDSSTHLLSSVAYELAGPSQVKTSVETRFSDWRPLEAKGQMVPWKIERIENGIPVVTLTVTGARLAATAADGMFTRN